VVVAAAAAAVVVAVAEFRSDAQGGMGGICQRRAAHWLVCAPRQVGFIGFVIGSIED
jgi:hypothetical protein